MNFNKFYLCFLIFIVGHYKSDAQEAILAKAYYKFSHVKDTAYLNYASTENMILLLGKSSSEYKSYDKMIQDSILLAQNQLGAKSMSMHGKKTSSSEFFFFNQTKTALESEAILKVYIFPIDYPDFHWKILPDTLTISGLACQKATGYWKGRIYEAWFCPQLPFNTGPWKLCGLPGLILKAKDSKNQVIFDFAGFQNSNGQTTIALPKTAIQTTKLDYMKLNEAFLENPMAFIKNSMPQIREIKTSVPYVRKPPINNPIELEK